MNRAHQKTLEIIFQKPVSNTLKWRRKEAKPYQLRDVREFLDKAKV